MATNVTGKCLQFVVLVWCVTKAANVTVVTNVGTFIGKSQTVNAVQVSNFLGIRYAEPPVGNLRFRKPVPIAALSGTQVVQKYESSCVGLGGNTAGSEDCLFLNVFAPERSSNEVLAVMVFIHGGGFAEGSSHLYDSNVLSALSHVIVVTMNYRLSMWGFLSTGDSNSLGNYGLWDQRMAIQWVSDNIGAFGGDRNLITVFGQSAGSVSAIYQAMYPLNKGVFKRVIAQSGSASAFWAFTAGHVNEAKTVATSLGCDRVDSSAMMDCLRELPFDTINNELNNASSPLASNVRDMFKPSVDGVFVKAIPRDVFNIQVQNSDVTAMRDTLASFDYFSGINSGEGAYILNIAIPNFEAFLPSKVLFDKTLIPVFVKNTFEHLTNVSQQVIIETIIAEYTNWDEPENSVKIRDNLMQLYSDYTFYIPSVEVLKLHSSLSRRKTYMYYFDVVMTQHVLSTPTWSQKPNHGDVLFFLFFPHQLFSSNILSESDMDVLEQIQTIWSNFAKTGDPNLPNDLGFAWQPHTSPRYSYLHITRNTALTSVKNWLFADKVNLWTSVFPAIGSAKNTSCGENDSNQSSVTAKTRVSVWLVCIPFLWTLIRRFH